MCFESNFLIMCSFVIPISQRTAQGTRHSHTIRIHDKRVPYCSILLIADADACKLRVVCRFNVYHHVVGKRLLLLFLRSEHTYFEHRTHPNASIQLHHAHTHQGLQICTFSSSCVVFEDEKAESSHKVRTNHARTNERTKKNVSSGEKIARIEPIVCAIRVIILLPYDA